MRHRAIVILALLVTIIALVGCGRPKEKYRIGYVPIIGDLPVMVAHEKGYFRDAGLNIELVEFASGNDAMTAVLSGRTILEASIGYSTLFSIQAKSPGGYQVVLSAMENDSLYGASIIVRTGSDIQSLNDLKGKRIGTYSGPTHRWTVELILSQYPDLTGNVEIVQVEPKLQVPALQTGQFDALFTIEPYATIAIEQGIARMLVPNARGRFIQSPFWAAGSPMSSEFIAAHHAEACRVIEAINRAVDFIATNEDEAKMVALKYTPLDSATVKAVRLYDWVKLGDEPLDVVQSLADKFFQSGLMDKRIDAKELFDSTLVTATTH